MLFGWFDSNVNTASYGCKQAFLFSIISECGTCSEIREICVSWCETVPELSCMCDWCKSLNSFCNVILVIYLELCVNRALLEWEGGGYRDKGETHTGHQACCSVPQCGGVEAGSFLSQRLAGSHPASLPLWRACWSDIQPASQPINWPSNQLHTNAPSAP